MHTRMPLAALLLAGCIPSFDGIVLVDDGGTRRDAGAADAGAGDAGAEDAGPADGGVPFTPDRIDLACETAWTELAPDAGAPCDGRRVLTLGEPISSYALAIARATDGTLTVAYNEMDTPDFGRIATVHFDEDAPETVTAGPTIEPESAFGDVVGLDIALATEPPDVHHLAYWLRSDFGHQVLHQPLRDGVFGEAQPIASAVGRTGVVDVAVDSNLRVVFAWHDDESGGNAARRERADGTLTAPATIRNDGDARLAGPGAVALAPTFSGGMHMAFQWSVTLEVSAPSYAISAGDTWSNATTLDNRTVARRTSGVGVDLTTIGDEVVVAYLDWSDGIGEIRFARFLPGGDVMIERYLEGITIDHQPAGHPIALATDPRDGLHLVVAVSNGSTTELEYHRQTSVGGERRWIADTIARLRTRPDEIHVDMKLGPDRRPHIVYWDPVIGGVRYATLVP